MFFSWRRSHWRSIVAARCLLRVELRDGSASVTPLEAGLEPLLASFEGRLEPLPEAEDVADEAERWLGKPVLAINATCLWHALRSLDFDDQFVGPTRQISTVVVLNHHLLSRCSRSR